MYRLFQIGVLTAGHQGNCCQSLARQMSESSHVFTCRAGSNWFATESTIQQICAILNCTWGSKQKFLNIYCLQTVYVAQNVVINVELLHADFLFMRRVLCVTALRQL